MCRGIRGSKATALMNVGLPVGLFRGTVLKMVDLFKVLDAVGMFKGSALNNFEMGKVKSNS